MFEMWADKNEPAVRLITRAGSSLPADLGPRDWLRLGPATPDATATAQIEALGYHFFRSEEKLPDPGRLKDSNAAGA